MVFVFFMFIFIPKCLPSSLTLLANILSSLSLSAVIPVSLEVFARRTLCKANVAEDDHDCNGVTTSYNGPA